MNTKLSALSLFVFLSSHLATASVGGSDVGGGKGVVCRDEKGQVQSVELLDLWEARTIYGRTIPTSSVDVKTQVLQALDVVKTSIYTGGVYTSSPNGQQVDGTEEFRRTLEFWSMRFLNRQSTMIHWLHGAKLALTDDSFETATPRECGIEQLVRFTDTNSGGDILVDADLVEKMDATNQAALFIHEALYAELRGYRGSGDHSSLRARRAVGLTFSGHQFVSPDSILASSGYVCEDARNRVFLLTSSMGATALVEKISGRKLIDYDGIAWGYEDAEGNKNPDVLFAPDARSEYDGTMGGEVDFDISYSISFAKNTAGDRSAVLTLTGAPDLTEPVQPVSLPCTSLKK